MPIIVWDEWDGRGFDDAVAVTLGHWEDVAEAWKSIKRLGIEIPPETSLELVHGYVGVVEEDIIYDICNASGITWADDDVAVDPGSIRPATFAIFVPWE